MYNIYIIHFISFPINLTVHTPFLRHEWSRGVIPRPPPPAIPPCPLQTLGVGGGEGNSSNLRRMWEGRGEQEDRKCAKTEHNLTL